MKVKKISSLYKWMVICIIMVGCIGISATMPNVFAAEEQTEEQRFTMEVKTGQDENVKVFREFLSTVTVTNNGEDFEGYIQAIFVGTYNDNFAYQVDLSIAAGETKVVEIPLRTANFQRKYTIRITDKNEKVIEKVRTKINIYEPDMKVFGVLAGESGGLGYLDTSKSRKIHYLKENSFPEQWEGLDMFDAILIDGYDTKKLSDKQYEALKEWVENGGTIYLGTGKSVSQVMGIFQDDFLVGNIGEVSEDGVAKISVEESEVRKVSIGSQKQTMYQVKKELGSVCVFTTAFGVEKKNWEKAGNDYIEIFSNNLSGEVEKELDYYDSDYYYYNNSIIVNKDELPKLKGFVIVLIIYCIVISFGAYFLLKHMDRLEWTWKIIPTLSLIFFIIIYAMGSSTRVTEPFISYERRLEYANADGKGAKASTHLNIISPENKGYSLAIPEKVTVKPEISDIYGNNDQVDYDSYKIKFQKDGDQQIVTFKNITAFEGLDLRAEETLSKEEGSCSSDVKADDYKYSGTFTNNLGMQIKNAVFIADNKAYKLGNIKNGDTVTISEDLKHAAFTQYWALSDRRIGSLFGIYVNWNKTNGEERTAEILRYTDALERYFDENDTTSMTEPHIVGLVEQGNMDETMTKRWGMECSGSTLCVIPVNVDYTKENGEIFIPEVLHAGTIISGGYNVGYSTMYGDIYFEVQVGQQKELTGLYMDKLFESCDGKGKNGTFKGEIKAYNTKTDIYEVVLTDTDKSCTKNLENYVDEDGKISFWYVDGCKDLDRENYIPRVSATVREVK